MTNEAEVKELAEMIKECGAYSAELDGYVINPATVACKISNSGYIKKNIKLTKITREEFDDWAKETIPIRCSTCIGCSNSIIATSCHEEAQLAHNLKEKGE